MQPFDEIIAIAARRKGGMNQLEALLATSPSLTPDALATIPPDRLLAAMTRRIFYAGFSWTVIDNKWPAFEQAFMGFDPHACAFMPDETLENLLGNKEIVRNGAKIRTVQANARFLLDLAKEHGSAARFFADWPDANYVGLLDVLKKRGSHLGGDSGMRFLRMIGKPAFVPTKDVVAALSRAGVIDHAPSSKKDMQLVQQAFNIWSAQSGRDLTQLSRILAMSTGE